MIRTIAIVTLTAASFAAAQTDEAGISVEPGAQLLHRPSLRFPSGAKSAGIVVLDATLDTKGEVADARVESGPEELRKSALISVLSWHYLNSGSSTVRITIHYGEPPEKRDILGKIGPFDPAPSPLVATIREIKFEQIDPAVQETLRSRLPIHAGDPFDAAAIAKLGQSLRDIDDHLVFGIQRLPETGGIREVTLIIRVPGESAPAAQPERMPSGNLITQVPPQYPPLARQARIQGTVRFDLLIGEDGKVENVTLIAGHPLLVPAATEAVKQWVYKPYSQNGKPIKAIVTANVNFALEQ
jgi:TonB family protein